nr:unnamed protein product [Digitaria exilis]
MRPPEKPWEYRPSRIRALGAVTGGPPGVPHGVGGGGRTAFTNHPTASAAAMSTTSAGGVLPVPDTQSIAHATQMSRSTPTHACIAAAVPVRFSCLPSPGVEAAAAVIIGAS